MKRIKTYFGFTSALLALALVMAGCGGGGGGTATTANPGSSPSYVDFTSRIDFGDSQAMRVAQTIVSDEIDTTETETLYQGCGDFATWIDAAQLTTASDAEVPVYVYVTEDAQYLYNAPYAFSYTYESEQFSYGPIASACTVAYRDTASQRVTLRDIGDFTIDNVEAGTNHLLEAFAYTDTQSMVYVAVVVPSVDEGYYTNGVVASPESTLAAAATIKYAYLTDMELSDVPATVVTAIQDEVDTLFPDGFSYGSAVTPTGFDTSVTFSSYYDFSSTYATGTITWEQYIISLADTADYLAPTVLEFTPTPGATNVASEGTVFSLVFNESLDITSAPDTLSLVLTGSDNTTITFDQTAGTESWSTTYLTNDTLSFTLSSNTTLSSLGFTPLAPGVTYTVSSILIPTNITDLAGNTADPSAANLLIGGSYFTTAASTLIPQVSSFDPAPGATDVWYDAPKFCAVFNQSMDTTVAPLGFSITIKKVSTGVTFTVDDTIAPSYGAFSWESRASSNDALCFTLFTNSQLNAYSLKTLEPSTYYQITAWTAPSGLMSADAQALDTTNIVTVGSTADFTTISGAPVTP